MYIITQDREAEEERWSNQNETDKDGDKEESSTRIQAQIQRLERENTDFLLALEDAMEQYKQQVSFIIIFVFCCHSMAVMVYTFRLLYTAYFNYFKRFALACCFYCFSFRVINCRNSRT